MESVLRDGPRVQRDDVRWTPGPGRGRALPTDEGRSMDEARRRSDRDLAVACLVELVAWHGEEGEEDYRARILVARKVLRKIAPEELRAELEAARGVEA